MDVSPQPPAPSFPTGIHSDASIPVRGAWPLLPLAPGAVLLFGVAVAVAIGAFGLATLRSDSDRQAAIAADLIAATLGARLARLPEGERLEAMESAARKTGAELLLVTGAGELVLDASMGSLDGALLRRAIEERAGEAVTGLGRARFVAGRLAGDAPTRAQSDLPGQAGSEVKPSDSSPVLIAFVRKPSIPEGAPALLRALVALTTLLVGVAAAVAYAVARDANKDVNYVAERVRGMVHVRSEPTEEAVPVRTMDEVGALTVAFNDLVERFAAARRGYQSDLARVYVADRDRAAFLAAVSHELRSPLNAILGFADVLMTEVDGPLSAGAREEVEQILGSGKHLLDLINDILELSALESGQLKLSRMRVDLAALAAEVVREAVGLVGARPVAVRMEPGAPVYTRADPKRVRQVITNLVGNAIKFTPAGEVVVDVAAEGRFARLRVRDTGPGIGARQRALLFQEYKQTTEERARRRGTGLGLATSRRLALMHGGTIQLESELGRGSTFTVLLPIWDVAPVVQPRRGAS